MIVGFRGMYLSDATDLFSAKQFYDTKGGCSCSTSTKLTVISSRKSSTGLPLSISRSIRLARISENDVV